jgi:hypothetical protein
MSEPHLTLRLTLTAAELRLLETQRDALNAAPLMNSSRSFTLEEVAEALFYGEMYRLRREQQQIAQIIEERCP